MNTIPKHDSTFNTRSCPQESPTVDIKAVIGSHLRAGDPWDPSPTTADNAVQAARTVLELCDRNDVRLCAGSNNALVDAHTPIETDATGVIIEEAMRHDADLPLFVTCGAGLTEIASAWLLEPRIGSRLVVVWIGGSEYSDLAQPPPAAGALEYNLNIDPVAAQVVFNESDIPIWQVPATCTATCLPHDRSYSST